jgi:hypothetical protein
MSQANFNIELKQITEEKKEEWSKNVRDISPLIRSKNPHDMTDAQALALSYRTMLLDEISYFLSELNEVQSKLKVAKKDKFILYTTGLLPDGTRPAPEILRNPVIGNQKITGPQKEMIISGDLNELEKTSQILNDTIEYLRECIKTIDQYMYAIKNRLELFVMFK